MTMYELGFLAIQMLSGVIHLMIGLRVQSNHVQCNLCGKEDRRLLRSIPLRRNAPHLYTASW